MESRSSIEMNDHDWQNRMADSRINIVMSEITDIVKTQKKSNKESQDKLFAGRINMGNYKSDTNSHYKHESYANNIIKPVA